MNSQGSVSNSPATVHVHNPRKKGGSPAYQISTNPDEVYDPDSPTGKLMKKFANINLKHHKVKALNVRETY